MISAKTQEQVLKLIQEKERIEKEIQNHGVALKNNNIGFNEPLVDSEGFPRNDIDVRSVRLARTQIVCLQNDLKDITKAIEEGLAKYFVEKKDMPSSSSVPSLSNISLESKSEVLKDVELKPFLIVSMVSENSPGSIVGLQMNDRILTFGSINCYNFKDLNQIGELVNNSKNHHIKIKLRRNEIDLELILTPKIWNGQGLLGFKINAIPMTN
ncbi:unnamed protein product [Chironomus riparius]|uniref:26S proteasome non-ATPase regulatory subunit 9 n=1 Tax=Chironomus riparius TaxID=315576 RepID=A0A9N9WSZ1_9DIPT|nr:unnamed protein product [Chironomus riparius]